MAGGAEVGTAYVTVIPKADGFSETISRESQSAGFSAGGSIGSAVTDALKSTVGNLFGTGGEMGSAISGGIESFLGSAGKATVVGAVAAIAAAAVVELEHIGSTFDEMTDTIVVGTGASGDALDELRQRAMSVSQDVAVSFGTSGDIIQDFKTRLGLSGDELQSVATHAAKLNDVLGGVNYDKMATMFNVWGVSADEMNAKMDYMFGVAQNTGVGFDNLSNIMQSAGPTLQNLGFSFEESANMAGLLDKAGIDASSTMSRMSKALVELSQPGESAQDAFRRTIEEMQGFIAAGDTASAMDIATNVFGTRGAAQFIGALQSGAMNLDAISDSALGASGSIDTTYEAVESWPELWQRIQNSVQAALEPLASATFEAVGAAMEGLSAAMTWLWDATEPLSAQLDELVYGAMTALAPVAEQVGGALSSFAGSVMSVAMPAFNAISSVIGTVANVIGSVLMPAIQAITAVATPIVTALGEAFGEVATTIFGAVSEIAATVGGAFDAIRETIGEVCEELFGDADVFPEISSIASAAMQGLRSVVGPIWNAIKNTVSSVTNAIKSVVSAAWPVISNVVKVAADAIKGAIDGISSVVSGVRSTFNAVKSAISEPINKAKDVVKGAIDKIKNFFPFNIGKILNLQIPHISVSGGEPPFGIGGKGSLPSFNVTWAAHGGIVDGATLIGAGERGPEAIVPLSGDYMRPFARAIADEMGGGPNVYVGDIKVTPESELYALLMELGERMVEDRRRGGKAVA